MVCKFDMYHNRIFRTDERFIRPFVLCFTKVT